MGTLSTGFVAAKTSPTKTPAPVPPVIEKKLADTPVLERNVSINNPSVFLN
jgi:hypothetical protein